LINNNDNHAKNNISKVVAEFLITYSIVMKDQTKIERVTKRIDVERSFYSHLLVYLAVNGFLMVSDIMSNGPSWWYYPALGWGIGLFSHWLRVFGPSWFPAKQWEKKRFEQLMNEDVETGNKL
jgi:hypothetical protein